MIIIWRNDKGMTSKMKRLIFGSAIAVSVFANIGASCIQSPIYGAPRRAILPERSLTFFVATTGSDDGPGTLRRPFATISRAQAAVRSEHGMGPVTVNIRAGVYYLSQPLEFTGADSDDIASPVTFQGYLNERPVLSAGMPLHLHWTVYKNGIYQAALPARWPTVPDIDQLFINGEAQHMARYPNYDPTDVIYHGTASDVLSPDRVKTWSNPEGGYVHGLHQNMWGSLDYRITGSDGQGNLTLEGGWQNNRPAGMSSRYRFVENVFEELDAPGEWYLNRQTRTLYVMPPAGVSLQNAVITGTTSSSLVEFRGTAASPVSNITMKNLEFTQTSRTFMLTKEPLLRSDWRIYRGGVVFFTDAENCAVQNCDFTDVGGNAVFLSGYNRRVKVADCNINRAGASGICFVGNPDAVRSPLFQYDQSQPESSIDTSPGPATSDYPAECIAQDDLITQIGEIEKQAAGVEIDMARDITVSHCSIYDVPRSGINIGDGCWGGHVIADNDVFDTVKESGDHGSFNSWGRDRYWMPDRNEMNRITAKHPDWFKLDAAAPITLRNNRWVCRHGWDIDLDDGSSNYVIENNLCLGGGIKNREGAYRDVENNVLVDSTFHSHVWFVNSNDIFAHNIVMRPYQPIGMPPVWGSEIDFNLLPSSAELAKQQLAGRDRNSLAGDPEFVSPATGNFQVRETSPAIRVGFKNFPMDQFGVTSPRLRAHAKNGFDYALTTSTASSAVQQDAVAQLFAGATVQNVSTMAQQSAAGLPEIRGVMVMAAPAGSLASTMGLKNLDVIWAVDGSPVSTMSSLMRELSDGKTHSITIYRNQATVMISYSPQR
jgi:hypothetical protein